MKKPLLWLVVSSVLTFPLIGCSTSSESPVVFACIPGQVGICPCEGGTAGTQECSADGVFSACICADAADGFVGALDGDTGVDRQDTDSESVDADAIDSDNEGADTERSDADTPANTNLCGGIEPLFYDGVAAAPGDECLCGGRLGCTDGGNRLTCIGSQPPNECGGCGALPSAPGEPCGDCAVGTWVCAGDVLVCDGGVDENACGGCVPLLDEPGTLCDGPDGAGLWACDGDDALLCLGEGRNACGGLGLLPSQPGTPCGQCLGGTTICAGREATVCRDAELRVNVCGGCGTLEAEPGAACGCEGSRACDPDNPDVLLCENAGLNACGGCDELEGSPGDTCAGGRLYCASPDQLLCGTAVVNACGGSEPLAQVPGAACGTCDAGVWACASLNSVFCDGDRGIAAANECGGCSELPALPASRCGTCNSGAIVCDGLESVVCVGDRGPSAERVFYADVDRDLWGDPAVSVRACTAPEGYVERVGDCNDRAVLVNPDALEIPGNGVDDNCDLEELCYRDADGDGFRAIGSEVTVLSPDALCRNPGAALATAPATDCDDTNPNAFPGNDETVGNGVDENCDRRELCFVDADGDGYRRDDAATVLSSDLSCGGNQHVDDLAPAGDCDDGSPTTFPGAPELCDGQDNDCNNIEDDPSTARLACALDNAVEACTGGGCTIATCLPGWGDCNDSTVDGCERLLLDDVQHCGACGRRCSATDACVEGACIPQRQPVAILSEWPMCIRRYNDTVSCMGYGVELAEPSILSPSPTLVDIPWLTGAASVHATFTMICAVFADQRIECRAPSWVGESDFYDPPTVGGASWVFFGNESLRGCLVDREGLVRCWGDGVSIPTPTLPARALSVAFSSQAYCALLENDSVWCWGKVPTPGVQFPPQVAPFEVAAGEGIVAMAVTNAHVIWLTIDGALNRRGADTGRPCSEQLFASGVSELLPSGPYYRTTEGEWFRDPNCFSTTPALRAGDPIGGARTSGILLEYLGPPRQSYDPPDSRKLCQIYTDLTSACGALEWHGVADPDLASVTGQFNGIGRTSTEYPFCNDQNDNDEDGLVNCQDPDCSAAYACAPIDDIQVGNFSTIAFRANGVAQAWGKLPGYSETPIVRPFDWTDTLAALGSLVNMEIIDVEAHRDETDLQDTICYSAVPTLQRECFGQFSTLPAPDPRSIIDVVRTSSLWVLTYENQLFQRAAVGWDNPVSAFDAPNLDQIVSAPAFHGVESVTMFGRTRTGDVLQWAFPIFDPPPAELTFETVLIGGEPVQDVAAIAGDSALACLRYESGDVYCAGSTGVFSRWATDATEIDTVGGTLCSVDSTNALRCIGRTGFPGTLQNVTAFDLGASSGCAVIDRQQIWCWGSNLDGQLGNGSSGGYSPRPVRVFGQ